MKKRKHRKVYQLINPLAYALEGAAVTPEDTLNLLRQGELTAIEAFRMGHATVEDWKRMSEVCNLTESMASAGIGPEALDAVARTHDALVEAAQRYDKTGKMGTTAQGLTAFRDVYEYHDLQRQAVARSVYERHIEKVKNKIISKSPDVLFVHRKDDDGRSKKGV